MINRVLYLYVNTWNDKSCPLSLNTWNVNPSISTLILGMINRVLYLYLLGDKSLTLILGMINRVLYLYVNTWNDKSCPLSLR